MLAKLIKHEFKANAKFFTIFFGAILILSCISRLFGILSANLLKDTAFSGIFSVIAKTFFFVTVIVLLFSSFAVVLFFAARYCKGLMGNEGYILFTLPVKPYKHILARIFVSVSYFFFSILIDAAALFILGCGKENFSFKIIISGISGIEAETGINLYIIIPVMLLTVLIFAAYIFSIVFLSASIGAQFNDHRVVYSVVAFLIMDFTIQIFAFSITGVIAANVSPEQVNGFLNSLMAANPNTVICAFMGIYSLYSFILSVVMFFANKYLVTKRLNLI